MTMRAMGFDSTAALAVPAALTAYASWYPSVAALLAALTASSACAAAIDLSGEAPDKATILSLGCCLKGSAGDKAHEEVLAISPAGRDGKPGVRVERVAQVEWTAGSAAVDVASCTRTVTGFKECSGAVVTGDGLIDARYRGGVSAVTGRVPARVEVSDVGEVRHLVRVFWRGGLESGYATEALPESMAQR